jgi:hypothetical protein
MAFRAYNASDHPLSSAEIESDDTPQSTLKPYKVLYVHLESSDQKLKHYFKAVKENVPYDTGGSCRWPTSLRPNHSREGGIRAGEPDPYVQIANSSTGPQCFPQRLSRCWTRRTPALQLVWSRVRTRECVTCARVGTAAPFPVFKTSL